MTCLLQELCAAMLLKQPTPLTDEVHLCVLRALALYETALDRKRRHLDLSLLDNATWPEYVWEWLELVGDKELLALRYLPQSHPLPPQHNQQQLEARLQQPATASPNESVAAAAAEVAAGAAAPDHAATASAQAVRMVLGASHTSQGVHGLLQQGGHQPHKKHRKGRKHVRRSSTAAAAAAGGKLAHATAAHGEAGSVQQDDKQTHEVDEEQETVQPINQAVGQDGSTASTNASGAAALPLPGNKRKRGMPKKQLLTDGYAEVAPVLTAKPEVPAFRKKPGRPKKTAPFTNTDTKAVNKAVAQQSSAHAAAPVISQAVPQQHAADGSLPIPRRRGRPPKHRPSIGSNRQADPVSVPAEPHSNGNDLSRQQSDIKMAAEPQAAKVQQDVEVGPDQQQLAEQQLGGSSQQYEHMHASNTSPQPANLQQQSQQVTNTDAEQSNDGAQIQQAGLKDHDGAAVDASQQHVKLSSDVSTSGAEASTDPALRMQLEERHTAPQRQLQGERGDEGAALPAPANVHDQTKDIGTGASTVSEQAQTGEAPLADPQDKQQKQQQQQNDHHQQQQQVASMQLQPIGEENVGVEHHPVEQQRALHEHDQEGDGDGNQNARGQDELTPLVQVDDVRADDPQPEQCVLKANTTEHLQSTVADENAAAPALQHQGHAPVADQPVAVEMVDTAPAAVAAASELISAAASAPQQPAKETPGSTSDKEAPTAATAADQLDSTAVGFRVSSRLQAKEQHLLALQQQQQPGSDDAQEPAAKRQRTSSAAQAAAAVLPTISSAAAAGAAVAAQHDAGTSSQQQQQPEQTSANAGGAVTSAPTSAAPLLAWFKSKKPTAGVHKADFWALGVEANAAILARLCDDLLNTGAIRAEIDRRETTGCAHAGKGGAGGAFPVRTKDQSPEQPVSCDAATCSFCKMGCRDSRQCKMVCICFTTGFTMCCYHWLDSCISANAVAHLATRVLCSMVGRLALTSHESDADAVCVCEGEESTLLA